MRPVIAEVVTIGDEVCRGDIVDSNSAFLAAGLWDIGVSVAWMSSCRDLADDIGATLGRASGRADLVLVTGGLGPTLDDLTVDVVCGLVGTGPVVEAEAKARMDERTRKSGYVAEGMDRQVRVPKGARVHGNPTGLAPCFEVELNGVPVICLPGPPRELRPIFEERLSSRVAELKESLGDEVERIAHRIYRVYGRGESQVAKMVEGVCDGALGASLHFQVKFPETWVKVVVRDRDQEAAASRLAEIDGRVRGALGHYLYGIDDDTLAIVLGRRLLDSDYRIATAESCTGGLVGARLTDVPGSSAYFLGGAITYSDAEKMRQLGVTSSTLESAGAVSEACVVELAKGVCQRTGAVIGVAVSGVAGPGGGSEDKPVGTVWIAVCGPDQALVTRTFCWPTTRDRVREVSAHAAMAMALRAAGGPVR